MDGNGHGPGHGAAVLEGGIETHLRALGESLRALRLERGHSLGAVALLERLRDPVPGAETRAVPA